MQENQTEKKSILRVVIHSFFVVPLIISIFAVMIFLVIRIMTSEPNSARDYLEDVKIGGTTKRWQGAFELSKLLSNPKMVPKDEMFAWTFGRNVLHSMVNSVSPHKDACEFFSFGAKILINTHDTPKTQKEKHHSELAGK